MSSLIFELIDKVEEIERIFKNYDNKPTGHKVCFDTLEEIKEVLKK